MTVRVTTRCSIQYVVGVFWWMLLFFFQAEDGIRYLIVTGVQTCALPILTLLRAMRHHDKTLAELVAGFQRYPQILVNVRVREKRPFEELPTVRRLARETEQRSEERRVGKSVDLGGRRIIKKKKEKQCRRE